MSAATKSSPKRKPKQVTVPDLETRRHLYREMLRARRFEQRAHELFLENLIKGTSHLALGQEAIAAGFAAAMQPDDYTFCTYRGHTHTLLRGASTVGLFGELMGRSCGVLSGKGGSMHLTSVEHGAMGSYAIVGAQLCIALGAGWSAQYKGNNRVTVVFFGDGTTNIGAFHEAINFAAVWKLPVVFVCENNLYMEYTPIHSVIPVEHPAADRAAAYGLESRIVDGNDVDAVYQEALETIDQARKGAGPSLIEAKTYRHTGHSRADPAKYRPTKELEEWLARDPLKRYRERLIDAGIAASELAEIEKAVELETEDAIESSKNSPPPSETLIMKDVWANGSATWRN